MRILKIIYVWSKLFGASVRILFASNPYSYNRWCIRADQLEHQLCELL